MSKIITQPSTEGTNISNGSSDDMISSKGFKVLTSRHCVSYARHPYWMRSLNNWYLRHSSFVLPILYLLLLIFCRISSYCFNLLSSSRWACSSLSSMCSYACISLLCMASWRGLFSFSIGTTSLILFMWIVILRLTPILTCTYLKEETPSPVGFLH